MQKGFEIINIQGCASGIVPVPVIGENGNWYIGNDDTGVKAQGEGGLNAYEIAVQQGFEGNMAEWLESLKGKTPDLAVNLTTQIPGIALDATMGKKLDDKICQFAKASTIAPDSIEGSCYYELPDNTWDENNTVVLKIICRDKNTGKYYNNVLEDMQLGRLTYSMYIRYSMGTDTVPTYGGTEVTVLLMKIPKEL